MNTPDKASQEAARAFTEHAGTEPPTGALEAALKAAGPHIIAAWIRHKKDNYPDKSFTAAQAKYALEYEAREVERGEW